MLVGGGELHDRWSSLVGVSMPLSAHWGALPADPAELVTRSAGALRAAPRPELGGWLPADELAEIRLVGAWLAAHDPPTLELDDDVLTSGRLAGWLRAVESAA